MVMLVIVFILIKSSFSLIKAMDKEISLLAQAKEVSQLCTQLLPHRNKPYWKFYKSLFEKISALIEYSTPESFTIMSSKENLLKKMKGFGFIEYAIPQNVRLKANKLFCETAIYLHNYLSDAYKKTCSFRQETEASHDEGFEIIQNDEDLYDDVDLEEQTKAFNVLYDTIAQLPCVKEAPRYCSIEYHKYRAELLRLLWLREEQSDDVFLTTIIVGIKKYMQGLLDFTVKHVDSISLINYTKEMSIAWEMGQSERIQSPVLVKLLAKSIDYLGEVKMYVSSLQVLEENGITLSLELEEDRRVVQQLIAYANKQLI